MNNTSSADKGKWIKDLIEDFIRSSENSLENTSHDKAFEKPLTGFAKGNDPIFEELKKDIGSFYMTPLEAFRKVFPDLSAKADELTVISWILPHINQTKIDNRKEKTFPSERWARGKKFGVLVNVKLQKYLIAKLEEAGCKVMAPCDPSCWSEQKSAKYGYASTWSERHTAYAAGLGTFGLCDGLITPIGKAMRCGSIIAHINIEPTKRPYTNHNEYCLFLSEGTCGKCIIRCPAGAITEKGHNKEKCRAYVDGICVEYAKNNYDLDVNSCGLCQTKVPCESGIPKSRC